MKDFVGTSNIKRIVCELPQPDLLINQKFIILLFYNNCRQAPKLQI